MNIIQDTWICSSESSVSTNPDRNRIRNSIPAMEFVEREPNPMIVLSTTTEEKLIAHKNATDETKLLFQAAHIIHKEISEIDVDDFSTPAKLQQLMKWIISGPSNDLNATQEVEAEITSRNLAQYVISSFRLQHQVTYETKKGSKFQKSKITQLSNGWALTPYQVNRLKSDVKMLNNSQFVVNYEDVQSVISPTYVKKAIRLLFAVDNIQFDKVLSFGINLNLYLADQNKKLPQTIKLTYHESIKSEKFTISQASNRWGRIMSRRLVAQMAKVRGGASIAPSCSEEDDMSDDELVEGLHVLGAKEWEERTPRILEADEDERKEDTNRGKKKLNKKRRGPKADKDPHKTTKEESQNKHMESSTTIKEGSQNRHKDSPKDTEERSQNRHTESLKVIKEGSPKMPKEPSTTIKEGSQNRHKESTNTIKEGSQNRHKYNPCGPRGWASFEKHLLSVEEALHDQEQDHPSEAKAKTRSCKIKTKTWTFDTKPKTKASPLRPIPAFRNQDQDQTIRDQYQPSKTKIKIRRLKTKTKNKTNTLGSNLRLDHRIQDQDQILRDQYQPSEIKIKIRPFETKIKIRPFETETKTKTNPLTPKLGLDLRNQDQDRTLRNQSPSSDTKIKIRPFETKVKTKTSPPRPRPKPDLRNQDQDQTLRDKDQSFETKYMPFKGKTSHPKIRPGPSRPRPNLSNPDQLQNQRFEIKTSHPSPRPGPKLGLDLRNQDQDRTLRNQSQSSETKIKIRPFETKVKTKTSPPRPRPKPDLRNQDQTLRDKDQSFETKYMPFKVKTSHPKIRPGPSRPRPNLSNPDQFQNQHFKMKTSHPSPRPGPSKLKPSLRELDQFEDQSFRINTKTRNSIAQRSAPRQSGAWSGGGGDIYAGGHGSSVENENGMISANGNTRISNKFVKDSDGFIHKDVQKSRRVAAVPMATRRHIGTRLKVATAVKKSKIFVSRLDPIFPIEKFKQFVRELTGTVCGIERLKTKYSFYSSFVITCERRFESVLLDQDKWENLEKGLLIRPFNENV